MQYQHSDQRRYASYPDEHADHGEPDDDPHHPDHYSN
jgi:hypothetical protein